MERKFQEEKRCAYCGKAMFVLHPSRWAYKRKKATESFIWFCSYTCMRAEESMKGRKLTQEQYDEAVRIAGSGGDQLAYLKKCGAKNPSATWVYIKKKMEAEIKEQVMAMPQIKVQEEKPILAEVVEKVPEVIVVPHDDIEKAAGYLGRKNTAPEKEQLEVMTLKSRAVNGACYVKKVNPVEGGYEEIMKMEMIGAVLNMGVYLSMNKEGWLQLIDEIRKALEQMDM